LRGGLRGGSGGRALDGLGGGIGSGYGLGGRGILLPAAEQPRALLRVRPCGLVVLHHRWCTPTPAGGRAIQRVLFSVRRLSRDRNPLRFRSWPVSMDTGALGAGALSQRMPSHG